MKKLLIASLTLLSLNSIIASQRDELQRPTTALTARAALLATRKMGVLEVAHSQDGFSVNGQKIPKHLIDKNLRDRTPSQMEAYLKHNYVRINKATDGTYSVHEGTRALGGGLGGASWGAWIGKGVGYGLGVGACYSVGAIVTYVAGPVVGTSVAEGLKAAALPAIETFSNVCAIGGGVIGGVLTGPV